VPARDAIERALDGFRGRFLQQPPGYSAKKIAGTRSYDLARAGKHDARPSAVHVTVHRLDLQAIDGDHLTLALDCSAGFYVRSLAHDLGERLAVGGHLTALRRTRSGDYTLDDALPFETAERDPAAAVRRLVPPAQMLPRLPAARLTLEGVRRARHGRDLGPGDFSAAESPMPALPFPLVRLLGSSGELVGLAEPVSGAGLLHPFVVLV